MRSRSEFFDILVNELNMQEHVANEIINKAFATEEKKKDREQKLNSLKEKYIKKLLAIDLHTDYPVYIFVNDIKSSCEGYFTFFGPYIISEKDSYEIDANHSYSVHEDNLECIKIVNDWNDDTEIDKHLFIHNYLYYQVCEKLVATALKKFINVCKID
jgi:hypothetical protein